MQNARGSTLIFHSTGLDAAPTGSPLAPGCTSRAFHAPRFQPMAGRLCRFRPGTLSVPRDIHLYQYISILWKRCQEKNGPIRRFGIGPLFTGTNYFLRKDMQSVH